MIKVQWFLKSGRVKDDCLDLFLFDGICYGGVFGRFVEFSEKALVWPIRPHDAWRRAVLLSSKRDPRKENEER